MNPKHKIEPAWQDSYADTLEKQLSEAGKRNKQLLTALRSAKRVIRNWHKIELDDFKKEKELWDNYQKTPAMLQINKAIKND